VVFGIIVGLIMALIFRKSEEERTAVTMQLPDPPASTRPLWKTATFLAAMIAFLVFSDWFNPGDKVVRLKDGTTIEAVARYESKADYDLQLKVAYAGHEVNEVVRIAKADIASIGDVDTWVTRIHHSRWYLAGAMGVFVLLMAVTWFDQGEIKDWLSSTWTFAKLLVPLLFGGVAIVGFLGALLPDKQVAALVGDNSLASNAIASVIGCLFYFATLTEIPILEALLKNGMASGPALALLLAGPALSIPSILVIRSVLGNQKTLVFCALVVIMATIAGMGYGVMFPENPVLHTPDAAVAVTAIVGP
jgi:uncharacterized membrane protein YraQ (UPF0718 family)